MPKLKLGGMASRYEGILQLPLDKHPDTHECIAMLLDAELQNRSHKRTQMLLRFSKLRYTASLQESIYDKGRNLTKAQIAQLADGAFIDRAEHIFITGAHRLWQILPLLCHWQPGLPDGLSHHVL